MAPSGSDEPLLQRPPSEASDDRSMAEADALLTGQRTSKQDPFVTRDPKNKWRELGLFAWAVLATAAVVALAVAYQHTRRAADDNDDDDGAKWTGKRNLIMMVSDGMGPTSLALAREWRQFAEGLPYSDTLVLDRHLIGQSRTRSSSSLVTDSAAGATAFSCAKKSYNGAISVTPDFEPCGSVMEAAHRAGYKTGLVVTTRLTDATPAVFASHVRIRDMEDEIALQMVGETHPLGRVVDLMLGGGRCHFLPNATHGSCRDDSVDVVGVAKEGGWNYVSSRAAFDQLGTSLPLPFLGLFAETDIPYEIDRRENTDTYPSLEEMTTTALQTLSAATEDSEQGFFVMIEGSRIDHAGHANDPAAQVHEVLAYDRAMAAVLAFIRDSSTPTLMVSTSDHETGGLSAARQLGAAYPDYAWYPGALANVSRSASNTSAEYRHHLHSSPSPPPDLPAYLTALTSRALGIHDPSLAELTALAKHPGRASATLADMVSRRARAGWSTHGHSGADVNVYASNPRAAAPLRGARENTEVGAFLRAFLALDADVAAITDELKAHHSHNASSPPAAAAAGPLSWLGRIPAAHERLDGQDHVDHYYAGEHTRRARRCNACGV